VPFYEIPGPTYLPPMLRPGWNVTNDEKEAIRKRCNEIF
jgi:hypothetical protein